MAAGFVVLRQTADGRWELLGEVSRRGGLPARRARSQAIADATGGTAREGETYAVVLRSEWRVSLDSPVPGS